MYMRILIVNGPNLGLLGLRQPEIYGTDSLEQLIPLLRELAPAAVLDIELEYFQSNAEGALIDRLELARAEKNNGLVFNAGAYTHTSLALADCLAWIGLPCIEVHISNVYARAEVLRHKSLLAKHCLGTIAGFGIMSYALAVLALWRHLGGNSGS